MCNAIYYIMRKLKGHTLHDVLRLSMPQFYFCIEMISKEVEAETKAHKKANSKRKSRR